MTGRIIDREAGAVVSVVADTEEMGSEPVTIGLIECVDRLACRGD